MDESKKNLSNEDQALVRLANSLLDQLHLGTPVRCVEDIGATVFVMLFEGLCGEHLPGIIRSPVTRQDEVHNCQIVIDNLGSEVLHTNLSHISGRSVIEGSRETIGNMLEIYSGLLDYIVNKIDSDISTDVDGGEDLLDDDPDAVEPEIIDRILESELQKDKLRTSAEEFTGHIHKSGPSAFWDEQASITKMPNRQENTKDSTDLGLQSSTMPTDSRTESGDIDTTEDLISEAERWENKLKMDLPIVRRPDSEFLTLPKTSAATFNEKVVTFSQPEGSTHPPVLTTTRNEQLRPSVPYSMTRDLVTATHATTSSAPTVTGAYLVPSLRQTAFGSRETGTTRIAYAESLMSEPMSDSGTGYECIRKDPFPLKSDVLREPDKHRTDGADSHTRFYTHLAPKTTDISSIHGSEGSRPDYLVQSDTYNTLQNMVEETAAMARAAVRASPGGAKNLLETMTRQPANPTNGRGHGVYSSLGRSPLRPTREVVSSFTSDESILARARSPVTLPRQTNLNGSSDSELSPSKARRKVSFLVDRSTSDTSQLDHTSPRIVKKAWEDEVTKEHFPIKSVRIRTASGTTRPGQKTSSRSSNLESEYPRERDMESYEDRLCRQFHEIVDDVSWEDKVPKPQSTVPTTRKQRPAMKTRGPLCSALQEKQLQQEEQDHKKKLDFIHKIYREDLDELLTEAKYDMHKEKKLSKQKENEFKKKILNGPQLRKRSIETKKMGGTSVLKKKTPAKNTVSSKAKKHSATKGIIQQRQKRTLCIPDEEEILPMMLREFPHLHLSLHTWHELWRKGLQQIEQVTRTHQEVHRKKSRAQSQLEEAEQRQAIMVNIMRKELEHSQRLKDVKDRKAQYISAKNKIHERRMQSAKSRQYYDEYQVRLRAKMLKRRTREEMIFKKLFKDGLSIQKDRMRELRKYASEQRDDQVSKQRNEIDSLENYYRDQFEMLAESMDNERHEVLVRDKAQQKVLDQMKKEIRKKMEREIKDLQDQLCRDNDDAYFRELDADRVIHDLKLAKYHAKI